MALTYFLDRKAPLTKEYSNDNRKYIISANKTWFVNLAIKTYLLIVLIVVFCLDFDCTAAQGNDTCPADRVSSNSDKAHSFRELDRHFVPMDTFLVGDKALIGRDWIYVYPALKESFPLQPKMSSDRFFLLKNGKHVWLKFSWKSRIATKEDLKVGTLVSYIEKWGDKYYIPPTSYEEVSNRLWLIAKITDIKNIKDGYVTVSGPSFVGVDSLRVIVE